MYEWKANLRGFLSDTNPLDGQQRIAVAVTDDQPVCLSLLQTVARAYHLANRAF